jgi:steroid 5-alpha reductase family enzyme
VASDIFLLLGVNLAVTLGCMVVLWAISTRTGDPSFIDAWWPMGFVVVAWLSASLGDGDATRRLVLALTTTVWGVRLGGYLLWRWRRNGPDKRYVAMLRHAPGNPHRFTLRRVFLLQGALLWVVSLPLQLGSIYEEPAGLRPLGYAGLALCAIGIAFESIGDWQLTRFKSDPANDGKVMDRGLWRYTRHPNYFGDACTWWGLFFVAVVNPVTALAVVGPIVMTFLLVRYSGARLLERRLLRHKPDYADYVARTSAFVPLPPKRVVGTHARRPA